MSELDNPWCCPHGRPTMRHLLDIRKVHHRHQQTYDNEDTTEEKKDIIHQIARDYFEYLSPTTRKKKISMNKNSNHSKLRNSSDSNSSSYNSDTLSSDGEMNSKATTAVERYLNRLRRSLSGGSSQSDSDNSQNNNKNNNNNNNNPIIRNSSNKNKNNNNNNNPPVTFKDKYYLRDYKSRWREAALHGGCTDIVIVLDSQLLSRVFSFLDQPTLEMHCKRVAKHWNATVKQHLYNNQNIKI